jgi:hypothetical protein
LLDAFPLGFGQIIALHQIEQRELRFAQTFFDGAALLCIEAVGKVEQLGEGVFDRGAVPAPPIPPRPVSVASG